MDAMFNLVESMTNVFVLVAQAGADVATSGSEGEGQTENWNAYLTGLTFVLGIFVLPFVVSHFVTKAFRMPSHSFRLGVMLSAITAGFLFAWSNDFQLLLGPDMKGGTTLVYDIEEGDDGQKINAGALATALGDRINPSGTKEITIRPRGESQIEITVPNVDPLELDRIKAMIGQAGQLEFRIVANSRDHRDIIDLAVNRAKSGTPRVDVTNAEGQIVGQWFTVAREEQKVEGVFPLKTVVTGDTVRNTFTGEIIIDGGEFQMDSPLQDESYQLEKWMDRFRRPQRGCPDGL